MGLSKHVLQRKLNTAQVMGGEDCNGGGGGVPDGVDTMF